MYRTCEEYDQTVFCGRVFPQFCKAVYKRGYSAPPLKYTLLFLSIDMLTVSGRCLTDLSAKTPRTSAAPGQLQLSGVWWSPPTKLRRSCPAMDLACAPHHGLQRSHGSAASPASRSKVFLASNTYRQTPVSGPTANSTISHTHPLNSFTEFGNLLIPKDLQPRVQLCDPSHSGRPHAVEAFG